MSIGENTLLLKRGCLACNGLDFCGSLCINCNAQKASLPISIKTCQNNQAKTACHHLSLSSSLTVASPPPIFTLTEEERHVSPGTCANDSPRFRTSAASQSGPGHNSPRQMAINEHLFKEYREASSTVGLSSSAFELTESENEEDSDSSDDDYDEFSDDERLSTRWCFEDYFAALPGNDWCVRVPGAFIHDEFNLFEFPDVFRCPLRLTDFPNSSEKRYTDDYGFDDLLELITTEDLEYSPDSLPEGMLMDAVLLYKLIHQRYILSKQGLQDMTEKYEAGDFGNCPRHLCRGQALLPVGLSALPATVSCKVYCLNCQDLYTPASRTHAQADGVAFGPTFAHFLVRNVLFLDAEKAVLGRSSRQWDQFVPRIYGFRIAERTEKVELRSVVPRDYQ